jgi:putative transposase
LPRQARLDAAGTLHHVIVRGIEKRQIVDDDKDRADFVNRLGEIASVTGTIIYAWGINEHAHILMRSSDIGKRLLRSPDLQWWDRAICLKMV